MMFFGNPEGLSFHFGSVGSCGGSGPVRDGDVQRVMTTGTRVFRYSVPPVSMLWVGCLEDVGSVPLAVVALGSGLVHWALPILPIASSLKTGGG
ncbi:hypothetical protein AVEN_265531-1 [Araneus ventricosus]|uniref:Uncharacterized protein n=1 Tax=Araneus ventricosus TaxID=182803 RepID=A0A4Y2VFI2_ARAVE|nr:hypothetical protein AVEN_265531-1 [Araneus ventricosus]